jgi:DNA repair exonuclease SbcCD nuclease subunit
VLKPEVRLLHTSDLHIGADTPTLPQGKHRDPCLCALKAVLDTGRSEQVDAILIAGDLFDHARIGAEHLARVVSMLAEPEVPCVILPGNHDGLTGDSVYLQPEWRTPASSVTVLRDEAGQSMTLLSGRLQLWGRAVASHSPRFRPLVGAPRWGARSWHVALAHGHYVGEGHAGRWGWSSPITTAEIWGTGADYVALGHWHRAEQVNGDGVQAWYSGSPTGGIGDGGALIVVLSEMAGTVVSKVTPRTPADGCLDGW